MELDQVADLGVGDLGVDARLVEQAEVVDEDALLLVLLEIAQVVVRQGAKILVLDVLAVRGPRRWSASSRADNPSAPEARSSRACGPA